MIDRRALLVLLVLGLSAQAHAGDTKGGTLPPWTSGTLTPAVIPVTSSPVTTTVIDPPPAIKTPAVMPDSAVKTPPDVGKTPAIIPLSPAAPSGADTSSAALAASAAADATAAAIAAANAAPAASDNSAAIAAAAAAEAAAAAAASAASSTAIPSTSLATTGTGSGTKPPPITLPPPSQFPGQIPSQIPGQIPSQIPGQLPTQLPGQLPPVTQFPGQLPTQFPGQLPTQFPGQLPTQFPGQLPTQFPGQLPTVPGKLPTTLPLPTVPGKVPALPSSTAPAAAHTAAVLPAAAVTDLTNASATTVAASATTDAANALSAAPSTHFQGFAMSEKAYELVDMQVPTPAANARGQRGTITIGGDAFTLWNYRVAGPYVIKGQPSPYEAARSGDMASWRGQRTNSDVRVWQVSADVYPATAPAWHKGGAFYPRKAGQLWVRIIQKVDTNVYIMAPGPQTGIMDGFVSFWSARYRLLTSGAFNAGTPAVAAPSTSPSEPNTEDLKKTN